MQGRVAIVAGASRGIGAAAAHAFADAGAAVVAARRGQDALEAAGSEAKRLPGLASPMRRIGSSQEVAEVVVWLCSDAASYINGAVVPIDSGQSAGVKPPQMYRQGEPMPARPA